MKFVVHNKKEHFDVYIGRPGPWGNPFSHKADTLAKFKVNSREEAISRYEQWLLSQPELVQAAKVLLKGKILGCWCAPHACHGDVLSRVANED